MQYSKWAISARPPLAPFVPFGADGARSITAERVACDRGGGASPEPPGAQRHVHESVPCARCPRTLPLLGQGPRQPDLLQSGHLLPRLLTGDNEEVPGSGSDQDCAEAIARRQRASLLLYPEFDNRHGMRTVVTLTNVSQADDVRAHFIYVGRFGGI